MVTGVTLTQDALGVTEVLRRRGADGVYSTLLPRWQLVEMGVLITAGRLTVSHDVRAVSQQHVLTPRPNLRFIMRPGETTVDWTI